MNVAQSIQGHIDAEFERINDMEERTKPKPDAITKLFYVNWILEQSDNPIDEVMFLISLIEDETKNHEEKVKTLYNDIEWTFSNWSPNQKSKVEQS